MKDTFKKHGIKLGIAVAVVAIVVAISIGVSTSRTGPLANVAGAIRQPIQSATSSVVDWLESIYGYMYQYDQLKAENEELEAQLAQAQAQLQAAEEAISENERLEELLNLSESHADFEYASARIVSRSASNWANTMTLNKGSAAGLEVGDPVITSSGVLVGQIAELGDTWAEMRTIIDLDISVGALVGEAGNAAMVIGDFSLMQKGYMRLTYLTEGTNLLNGDTVLTSGKGGIFPQGLTIGTIVEVHTEAGGQTPYGVVEPACDLDTLSQIFVITDFDIVE